MKIRLSAEHIVKCYDHRPVLEDISFSLEGGSSLAITGKNGSGKSTLSKILAGVLNATSGKVRLNIGGRDVGKEDYRKYLGFVSPYLNMYDEFTAEENLRILSGMRMGNIGAGSANALLRDLKLWNRRGDDVGTYSSGMKQRLKYIFALMHSPHILILDEPTSGLDREGIDFVKRKVTEQRKKGIVIIASDDIGEAGWCTRKIDLQSGM
jgi:heme exporter protein A